MGGAALIALSVLLIGAEGLRQITKGENCSQTDIQCTIKRSSCFDFNWLRPFNWTPTAPSHMEVTAGVGQNEMGLTVPVLQIKWAVGIDSSILHLQGVEISVLELSTQSQSCVQFHFSEFRTQRNPNGEPWQFYYNNFEVNPGHRYYVTVQHLPKQEGVNNKIQEITVPRCGEGDMTQTDTCCNLGLCWFPNIGIKHQGENLTVEFSTRWDAHRYRVQVKVADLPGIISKEVTIQQGSPVQRVQVTFPNIGGYTDKECVYNISVWPYMPSCGNDCVRLYYVPPCATETPPPPEPGERWYLWSMAVPLTLMLFACIFLVLRFKDCFSDPGKVTPLISDPHIPPPTRKKVWMVYSADHGHYINLVIKLADFMQLAWGLEVVLDRCHLREMGTTGPMAWLDRQKDEIERSNGTILILCSRGAQEKWKAMQDVKEQKVTLKEDRKHPIGDLFTPALSLILPDFQKALPYDRYVVAYFSGISTLEDIPSLLQICPKFSLTENLPDIFFRIQRQEQHQPDIQLSVSYEEHLSYQRLVKEMESCKDWQQCNTDWFEKECLLIPVVDLEDSEEGEDVDDNATCKVYPLIRYPEISVSMVEPLILEPDPVKVLDPTIVIGAPSTRVEPFLSDIDTSVSIVQPLLHGETSAVVSIQEPRLVGEDPSLEECIGLLRQEVSVQYDQGVLSMEQLSEAQKRFFQNSWESPDLSDIEFMDPSGQDMVNVTGDQPVSVGEQFHDIYLDGQLMTPAVNPSTGLPNRHSAQLTDQGYSTWNPCEMDLRAIEMESLKLFMQNQGHVLNFEQV